MDKVSVDPFRHNGGDCVYASEKARECILTTPIPGEHDKAERLAYVESEEDQNGERSPF